MTTALSYAEQEAALKRAAAPALAAIEEDERRAPSWLRPLFAASRDLLFHPDLTLEQILEAAGFADAELWNAMREEVDQPPWNYLRDARLETAANLLRDTEMSVAEIGHLVGYGSIPSFRQLLRRFLGMPPSRYRRRARRRLARAGSLPADAETNQYWERMLAGELSDEEARALDAYLGRLAPGSAPATCEPDDRWTRLRRTLAEGLLETIDRIDDPNHVIFEDGQPKVVPAAGEQSVRLPFADQRRLVRDAVWFPDGCLFEALSERSRQADPERGVELAILGADYLAARRIPEIDPRLLPLAWARLARARWRAGDLPGARDDLLRSTRDAARCDALPAAWEAERSRIAAAFDWQRDRRTQALELARHSVAEHRTAGSPQLAAALVLHAELRAAVADLEPESAGARAEELRRALTDLRDAQDLPTGAPATGTPDTGMADAGPPAARTPGAGVSLQIRLLASIGTRAEIAAALPAVRRAAGGLGRGMAPRLRWLEGHATEDPEPAWRAAREGFAKLDDTLWVARATLDLARLFLAAKRPGEVAILSAELARALKATAPTDSASLEPLTRAAPFTAVTADDLDRAESILRPLEWQRRAQRALDLAW